MASVFKKPGSPYWYAAFRDHQDMRAQRSTKQIAHARAVQIANQFERAASKGRRQTMTEAQARRILAEIVEDTTGEALNFHTCRAWLEEWLAGKRGAVAEKSLEKYSQVTSDFLAHLGERAELPLAAISRRDVIDFRDAIAGKHRTANTVNQTVRKVLSAPFLAAVKFGYLTMNPCAAVEPLKDDIDAERETFTPAQVGKLVDAAEGKEGEEGEWRGVVLFGYFTGLRLRDITDLCWESIDLDKELLRVKTRKTGATITMPLHPQLTKWLRTRERGIGKAPVFPRLKGRGTGGAHGLSGRFKVLMHKAGVKGRILRGANGKGRVTYSLTFHSLRHSFVSALANAGVAKELRQKLSGHADDRSHARYTHHEIEVLRDAVQLVPTIPSTERSG
jgi:integrase